ncbi:unnamed protein product, partial [Closterium sp. NIES-54]
PPVLAFDAEGRPVKFETWLDDLHLFLQLTAKDDISLYNHALCHTTAPAATADSTARSQWQTRDAHARFAIRNSLPIDEREHFGQHKTAQALYTAVVARYSSPASAALGRLSLPYLFPDLASFHTVADLITHLRTSEARFRAAMPHEDHFLARCPTELTIALLEKELLAAETSIVAVGASRGDPRTPFFAGCSPSPLLPFVASAAAVDLLSAEKVGTASASSGRRSGKGKGGKGGGGDSGGGGAGGGGGGGGGSGATGGVGSSGGGGGGSGWGGGRGGGSGGGGGGRGGGRGWGGRGGGTGGGGRGGTGGGQGHQHSPSPQEPCGGPHATQRCFARLNDAWRVQFPQATELPRWVDLLKKGIDIYALDFDAILTAMYVMSTSGEGAEYLCVPPDPGIRTSASAAPGTRVSATPGTGEAAALGACASAPPGTESTAALHTFTLDSGASRCFFRDRTALEPLARPVAVSLADPSGGPVIATSSVVLPCPAVPSGTLSGLHLPSFSTNLVAGCALQDGGVHQFTPAYERVTHCTCARTGRHLATFTRQPGSDLYTLTTGSPHVAASAYASASGQLSAPCSCRSLAHETVLWHHRLGHPSVQRLRAMHSRYLPVSLVFPGSSLPSHPRLLLPVFPVSRGGSAPLLTPPRFPRRLLPCRHSTWTCGAQPASVVRVRRARLQLSERFHSDFPVLRLHSDRGGEFSSDLLAAYCAEHGIEQSFTLPASPQQNGVAERRIGLVMEVARTSLIHAAAPHFLWPFAVRYAAHQLNLWPRVSLPETSPTLLWTGEVGDASRFRVWGSRAFVRDTSADKLSSRAVPCVFLGFVPDAPGWQFYHATSRRVLSSQDVTFDESVPYYRLFPYRTAPLPPPPLFLTPGAAVVDPLPPQGAAPSGVEPGGAEPGGAELEGAESGGAAPGGAEPEGAESGGAEPGSPEPWGAESGGLESGGPVPTSPTPGGALSSEQLREWYFQYCSLRRGTSGARRTPGAGAGASRRELPSRDQIRAWYERRCTLRSGAPGVTDPGATGTTAGAEDPGAGAATGAVELDVGAAAGAEYPNAGAAAGAVEPGVGAATGSADPGAGAAAGAVESGVGAATGAGDPNVGAAAGAEDPGAGDSARSGLAARRRPYFVPLLQQVLGLPPSPGSPPPSVSPQPVQSQLELRPASPLPALSPYTEPPGGLAERREPASRPVSPVRTARTSGCGSRLRPPPVPGTHRMSLRLSTAPLRVPLPSPPESSLPVSSDPASDSLRAASPTVPRLLATVVTDPSFESTAASALVTELVDFAARCRLDYAASLFAESESVCPPSIGGECALGTDVLEDRQEEFQCLAAASPHLFFTRSLRFIRVLDRLMSSRLEHRTKHIALRYFLARELQQRGQLRLAYVASEANTADIFTKALVPCDHQRFCTLLGLVPTWPHLLTS